MCALKSRGMSVVCTWGLRGIFFHTNNFLCSSPTVLCAFVQVLSSTYVPYNIPLSLILRILCSSTFVHTSDLLLSHQFYVEVRCVRTSDHMRLTTLGGI